MDKSCLSLYEQDMLIESYLYHNLEFGNHMVFEKYGLYDGETELVEYVTKLAKIYCDIMTARTDESLVGEVVDMGNKKFIAKMTKTLMYNK